MELTYFDACGGVCLCLIRMLHRSVSYIRGWGQSFVSRRSGSGKLIEIRECWRHTFVPWEWVNWSNHTRCGQWLCSLYAEGDGRINVAVLHDRCSAIDRIAFYTWFSIFRRGKWSNGSDRKWPTALTHVWWWSSPRFRRIANVSHGSQLWISPVNPIKNQFLYPNRNNQFTHQCIDEPHAHIGDNQKCDVFSAGFLSILHFTTTSSPPRVQYEQRLHRRLHNRQRFGDESFHAAFLFILHHREITADDAEHAVQVDTTLSHNQ